ncbi:hypothetical protein A5700_13755 [Mycobacterium sp. E1214]|nr:hypothetical protein A5700_13755 [Mycobacterium sp. E1214]OBH30849.1 hypothetical protein A5693_17350 [Mycobacterium sp. E1319]
MASEIALARRDFPARGSRHLGFAKALVYEMPHTLAALDLLAQEQAYRLYRWELPDWHPVYWAGEPNDLLVLTADDRLLPSE